MGTINQKTFASLILAAVLLMAGAVGYLTYRQQVFELLASGTQWVLITCGFVPENGQGGGEGIQSDRLRKLYYAARMYNETPPKELSTEDRIAAELYPGMGFGMVHTFDTRPVSTVIGGWLFAIPCTYFTDSRDCDKTLTSARLKVSATGLQAINLETVEQFLSADSADIIRITIAGLEGRPPSWWQSMALNGDYYRYSPPESTAVDDDFLCTDEQWARGAGVMDHCVLRFMAGDDVMVEVKFSSAHRQRWVDIKQKAKTLVSGFQVRQ